MTRRQRWAILERRYTRALRDTDILRAAVARGRCRGGSCRRPLTQQPVDRDVLDLTRNPIEVRQCLVCGRFMAYSRAGRYRRTLTGDDLRNLGVAA